MSRLEPEVPPTGEELHLPGPSVQPVLLAFGITLAIVGVTTSMVFVVAGLALTVGVIAAWIRDTRRDIEELPLHHDEH
ncbi:MAG: hypothetical protein QOG35_1332 [Solirubrobacteraceae bacterium]|jgi:hypothetical protein|nr:hypothetical protein [Solirubrobacteraceae bacterium]